MKNKIDVKDYFRYLGIGVLMALLGGIVSGVLDTLLSYINISISFTLIILVYFVAIRMRSVYSYYHILYPITSLFLLFLGLGFSAITGSVLEIGFIGLIQIISPTFWFTVLIEPVFDVIIAFGYGDFIDIIMSLINIVIYVLSYIYTFKITKGRN